MQEIIKKVQKELGVNSCSSRVLDKLAEMSGLVCEFVKYGSGHSIIYGVKRKGSKGYRIIDTAKNCAEYMASEIE